MISSWSGWQTCDAAADAIRSMLVRGAPLIGATAAYGMALAMRADASDAALDQAYKTLVATRPTAINLQMGARRDAVDAAAVAGIANERRRPIPAPAKLPRKTSPSTRASAGMALA